MDDQIAGEDRDALAEALERLSADERTVMTLYYENGLKYREIGALMGICESRVCQLRSRAVDRLRKRVHMSALQAPALVANVA
jgi:RNA polymerase sigma factor for flagellar operon FliA